MSISINDWFVVMSERVRSLFNLNQENDRISLQLLERVLNNEKLNFSEAVKVEAINIFLLSKLNGEITKDALAEALWFAAGQNMTLYKKALNLLAINKNPKPKKKITVTAPKKHVPRDDRSKETKEVTTPASPKQVTKPDKPKPEIKKSKNLSSETPNRENKLRVGIQILIIALLISLVIVVIVVSCKPQTAAVVNETTTTAAETTVAPTTTTTTPTTWQMIEGNYGNNRWFTDGIVEIKTAKTDADAFKAAFVWLDRSKSDANLLVAFAKYFLNRDVDKATLVDNGWATDVAVQLVAELELVLGQAKVTVEKAPKKGFNTGVENDTVVVAKIAIISGDRTAIRIDVTIDGKVISIWVMSRCGNIVTKDKSELPIGKTDEIPSTTTITTTPPATTTTTTPPTTTTLEEKSDDPNDYQTPDNKPTVTTVTTPPESTPQIVITIEVGGSVTETPTNSPGSETGVDASGSTPTETTTVPATELNVNPGTDNSGTNTGDSGLPFQ